MKYAFLFISILLLACNNSGNVESAGATPLKDTAPQQNDSLTRININGMPADVPLADSITRDSTRQ